MLSINHALLYILQSTNLYFVLLLQFIFTFNLQTASRILKVVVILDYILEYLPIALNQLNLS